MDERNYWLGFSVFPGVGPSKFALLLSRFGTAKDAWSASENDLQEILKEKLTVQFLLFRQSFSFSEYEERLRQKNVSFLILSDSAYPALLKSIKNPPFVLYGKNLEYLSALVDKTIGVVGARSITSYGREVTELFTRGLVSSGVTIVSGLAEGVDGVAHTIAINNGGKTIAVLGCGVDICYPSSNQSLYNNIIEKNSVILSEVPLGNKPSIGLFPARNRIVAGLSMSILVTEGAEDSGSLITAGFALQNNRSVFAVPGPITSRLSKGPYDLLKRGAILTTTPDEILSHLGMSKAKNRNDVKVITGDSIEEQKIISLLENESLHFDDLVKLSGLEAAALASILSLMEMKGFIKNAEQNVFSL